MIQNVSLPNEDMTSKDSISSRLGLNHKLSNLKLINNIV